MQGFNMGRYVPPHLEGVASFNQASGKTAQSRNPDGSQTVRFECPFAIWCTNCHPDTIIAQGVRFNAQKKKIGNYYSTAIWSFRIKHTVCGEWIEVHTDPKNTEYVVVSGGRKRDLGGDRDESGEIVVEKGRDEMESVLGKLETRREGETAAEREKVRVEELKRRSERDWKDPYDVNKRIRKEFRVGRRQRQDDERTGERLRDKFGLGVDVVAPVANDGDRAKLIDFGGQDDVNSVSRGMFEVSKVSSAHRTEKDRGKRTRNDISEHKVALRDNLKGNTRASKDPFRREEGSWQKPTRRRRDEEVVQEQRQDDDDNKAMTTKATLVAYDSD